jgi:hypothetical protein
MTGVRCHLGGHSSQKLERIRWKKICEIAKQIILKFRSMGGKKANSVINRKISGKRANKK